MQYNSKTGNYEAMENGHRIEVDGDIFAEARQEMEKNGSSFEDAMSELLNTINWTGSLPMDGVYIDGKAQN